MERWERWNGGNGTIRGDQWEGWEWWIVRMGMVCNFGLNFKWKMHIPGQSYQQRQTHSNAVYPIVFWISPRRGRNGRMVERWNSGTGSRMDYWQNGGTVDLWNGRMEEWRNGGMAEWQICRMAEWRRDYVLNLHNIFTVHTDTDTDNDTLIF